MEQTRLCRMWSCPISLKKKTFLSPQKHIHFQESTQRGERNWSFLSRTPSSGIQLHSHQLFLGIVLLHLRSVMAFLASISTLLVTTLTIGVYAGIEHRWLMFTIKTRMKWNLWDSPGASQLQSCSPPLPSSIRCFFILPQSLLAGDLELDLCSGTVSSLSQQ